MELCLRVMNLLVIIIGWIISPMFVLFTSRRKPLPRPKQPEILNLSAKTLAEKIRTQQLTSEQVLNAFIERCQQVNGQLNAIVEDRFTDALQEAKNIDRLIRSNEKTIEQLEKETPLLGVPITVKEPCKVKGLSHTCGAKLRKGIKAREDGDAVANLRKSGAIPIAVTNIPELGCALETNNHIFGCTSNPYNLNYTPGGSSGGEGSLISSGASVLGLGSDVAGSIRVPCLYNGIFGHKPTFGIVSNGGHFPNHSNELVQKSMVLGPMCRYAEDLKPALRILAGQNAHLLKLDQPVNPNELKIYYLRDRRFSLLETPISNSIVKSIRKAINFFQTTQQCFTQEINLHEIDYLLETCLTQAAEVRVGRELLLLKEPEDESSLGVELLKALVKKSDYTMNTLIIRLLLELNSYIIPENKRSKYITALNNLNNRLKEILQEDGVLFLPTYTSLAHYKYQYLWKLGGVGYTAIVNVLGYPATHVTMGLNKEGLPTGFQVIGAPNQDRLCLAVAEELEKAFGGWVPPPSL